MRKLIITLSGLLLLPAGAFATPQDEIKRLGGEIDSLRAKLTLQQAVSGSLSAKLAAAQTQVNLAEAELEKTRTEHRSLDGQLTQLTVRISATETEMTVKKELARELIRSDYIQGQTTTAELLLGSDSFAEAYARVTYAEGLRLRLQDTVERLAALKIDLANSKISVEQDRAQVAALEDIEASQTAALEQGRNEQRNLLAQSRAAETSIVAQIARRAGEAEAIARAVRSVSNSPAEKQKESQAVVPPGSRTGSFVPQYFQTDPRWGSVLMNDTDSTVRDFGCAIASIAMVLSYYGYAQTPAQIATDQAYFYGATDLIQWSGADRGISAATDGHFSWSRPGIGQIPSLVSGGAPVLVWIEGAFGANTRHFVVITGVTENGDWVMNDPVRGRDLRFSAFYTTGQVIQTDLIRPTS